MRQKDLVGIREASQILRVSETALRQWTDEGKIKAFITPGGHRRYLTADLKKFMSSHRKLVSMKDLASHLEASAPLHKELDKSFLESATKYKMYAQAQTQFAALGRQILILITKYVSEPPHRDELLPSVKKVGADLGEKTAAFGMSLTDSIQIFIQHREPLIHTTTEMMKNGEGVQRRVVDAIPLVNHAMDEALVALVAAYQQRKNKGK
jgi:excisionase family DNA binding protein